MTTQPAPYITRTLFGTTPEADCTLCDGHISGAGIWAHDIVQDWVDDHAAECTPESVRVKARHLWDAANLLADHADADPDDGTDWEDPAIRAAVVALRLRLQGTANRLAAAARDAQLATATEGTAR